MSSTELAGLSRTIRSVRKSLRRQLDESQGSWSGLSASCVRQAVWSTFGAKQRCRVILWKPRLRNPGRPYAAKSAHMVRSICVSLRGCPAYPLGVSGSYPGQCRRLISSLCRNVLQVFIRDDDTLETLEQFCVEPFLLALVFGSTPVQVFAEPHRD